jgi:hypothetical protein
MRTTNEKTLARLTARMFSVAFAALLGSAFAQNAGWAPGLASDGTASMLDAGLEVTAPDGGGDGVGVASLSPSSLAEDAGVSSVAFDGGTGSEGYGGAGVVGAPVAQPGADLQRPQDTPVESPDGGVLEQPPPGSSWQQR